MRIVGFSYRTLNTRPTFQQASFNSTGENKALYAHSRSRTPQNYCTAAAAVVVIPSDVIGWGFSIELTTLGRIHTPNNLHSITPAKTEDLPN